MKLTLALTGYIAIVAGLLVLWRRFITISQAPDDLPHQDTDSHSATGAGEGFDRHVAARNTTALEQDHAAQI